MTKQEKTSQKLGMYGETPIIQIGNFEICEFSLLPCESIWIEVVGGEGAQFSKAKFLPVLKQFFHRNF